MLTDIIIFSIAGIALSIQLYYFIRYFSAIAFYKSTAVTNSKKLPISVIIAARNEYENLSKYLDSFLTQEYPDYEVVLVNDCSYDQSKDLLKEYALKYPHLKVVEIEEVEKYKHGKKFALTLGIKAAKHEHLLFSDADCTPVGPHWIQKMQEAFSDEKQIVLGHSPEHKRKDFLNSFSRFETFYAAFQYISFSLKGNTYMGIGRNMGYTKNVFFNNKGFASHMHVLSGDDDLFINEVSTKTNTAVVVDRDAFIYTDSKATWSEYFYQKFRHLSVGKYYKKSHKIELSLISISGFLFFTTLCIGAAFTAQWPILLMMFAFRLIFSSVYYYNAIKRLESIDLFWLSPILDFLYYMFIPIWSLVSLFNKPLKWK